MGEIERRRAAMRKLLGALEDFPGATESDEEPDDFCYRMGQTCTGVCPDCRPDLRPVEGEVIEPEEYFDMTGGGEVVEFVEAPEEGFLAALDKQGVKERTGMEGFRPVLSVFDEAERFVPAPVEDRTPELVEQMLADALPFVREGGRVRLTVEDRDTDRRGVWEVEKP